MTVHVPVEVINLCRDATVALSGPPVRLTLSALAETAVRREVERLSNASRPYANRRDLLRKGVLTEGQFNKVKDSVYVEHAKE